jgi:hypothetical protein
VTGQCQPESVEAGAEIRACCRYAHPHRFTPEGSHLNDLRLAAYSAAPASSQAAVGPGRYRRSGAGH